MKAEVVVVALLRFSSIADVTPIFLLRREERQKLSRM